MNAILNYALLLVLTVPSLTYAQSNPDAPHHRWKVGTKWDVEVTLFDRGWMLAFSDPVKEKEKHAERVLGQYAIVVEVTDKVSHKGVDCWQIDFDPDEKAPAGIREQKYRIWISTKDGAIRGLSQMEGQNVGNAEVEDVDGLPVLKNAPYGFPLEFIPWEEVQKKAETKQSSPRRNKLSVERKETAVDGAKELSVILKVGEVTLSSVRQKWGQGSDWWTEYEKHNRDHKELRAKLKGVAH